MSDEGNAAFRHTPPITAAPVTTERTTRIITLIADEMWLSLKQCPPFPRCDGQHQANNSNKPPDPNMTTTADSILKHKTGNESACHPSKPQPQIPPASLRKGQW